MSIRLTERQEECLRLSVTMTDKEIARVLGISHNTVDKHIRGATHRLGVSRRKDAVRLLALNPPDSRSDRDVDADRPVVSSAPSHVDRGLYGWYGQLGEWRTPPRSFRARTLAIFGWTAFGAVVLIMVIGLISLMLGAADGFAPTGSTP